MDYSTELIGARLRGGIAEMGLTYEEFAARAGVSADSVSNWANGENGMTLENACKCADVLGWPLDRLARRDTS